MTDTLTTGTVTELWQGVLVQAQARTHTRLGEGLESYLVFALVRHSRDAVLTGRIVALEYFDGLEEVGGVRDDRLRDVGDRCLLIAGLFPGLPRRRQVTRDYYQDLGRAAYWELAGSGRSCLAPLYADLAAAFLSLVRVLQGVRRVEQVPSAVVPESAVG